MNNYNYTGIFCINEKNESIWKTLNNNDKFSINEKCDYQNILLNASLLITDYSNVFYYFLFLKKPVIFSYINNKQYTLEIFTKKNFIYKLDYFGTVCNDIKCTIDEIIFEIRNSCIIKKKYLQNIRKILYFDKKNEDEIILKNKTRYKYSEYIYNKNEKYIIDFCMIFIIIYKFMKYSKKNDE